MRGDWRDEARRFEDIDKAAHHPCPRCGQPTGGAWSEGGLQWAICEECMRKEREGGGK